MEAMSPVFAAFGIAGCDLLDDLADCLDGGFEPSTAAEGTGPAGRRRDYPMRSSGRSAGREG